MSVLTGTSDDSAGVVAMACELATKIVLSTTIKQITIAAVLFEQLLNYVIETNDAVYFFIYVFKLYFRNRRMTAAAWLSYTVVTFSS